MFWFACRVHNYLLFGALQAVLFPVVNTRLVNNLTAIYWLDQNVICYVIHSGSVSKGDNKNYYYYSCCCCCCTYVVVLGQCTMLVTPVIFCNQFHVCKNDDDWIVVINNRIMLFSVAIWSSQLLDTAFTHSSCGSIFPCLVSRCVHHYLQIVFVKEGVCTFPYKRDQNLLVCMVFSKVFC